jgi:hypothetical protein
VRTQCRQLHSLSNALYYYNRTKLGILHERQVPNDKFLYFIETINKRLNITRMVWVIAFSSPDTFSINDIQLSMKLHHNLFNFVYHDKSCYRDNVNRAAGLRTGVMVFANSTYKLHLDMKPSAHLPGISHLDTFAWTRNLASIYRDLAKTTPPRHRRQLPIPPGRQTV